MGMARRQRSRFDSGVVKCSLGLLELRTSLRSGENAGRGSIQNNLPVVRLAWLTPSHSPKTAVPHSPLCTCCTLHVRYIYNILFFLFYTGSCVHCSVSIGSWGSLIH